MLFESQQGSLPDRSRYWTLFWSHTLRDLGLSDHDFFFAVRKQKLPKPIARILDYRSTKDLNANVFIADLKDVPWDSAYAFDNPDDVWSHWAALLQQVIEKHAPVKRTRLRFKQLPWINPNIRKEVRHRNRLYKRFRRAPTDANWDLYRLQRNKMSAMKRKGVKEFCAQAASDTSQGAVSSFWKKMKPLLPGDNACSDTYSISLIDDGQLIPDPARAFNEYFSTPVIEDSVIERTIQEFESHPGVALITGKHDDLAFSFEHVSQSYEADTLVRLDAKKSTGPDGLSPKILRIAAPGITAPLTKLFNYCFDCRQWPRQWKLSNVSPVYKKDEVTIKLLDNMSCFLHGHSCCTALVKLSDDWRAALDKKESIWVVAIDLSEAFDSVFYNWLLA